MNSWTFFRDLYANFDVLFLNAVQTNANNLLMALQQPMVVGVSVWLAGTVAIEMYQPGAEPFFLLFRKLIRATLVLGLIGAASFTDVFETFALTTLPNELTAAITGTQQGADALTPVAFDRLFQGGWVSIDQILKNVSKWDPQSILLALLALIEFTIGAFFIAIGFLVFIASHIMLGLAITVGPLFCCMLLWEKTVYLFNAWINVLLALVMTQVLIVALLGLLLTTETNLLTQITALNSANGANANDIAGQVHYLVEAAMLYFMIGYLSPKIQDLAQALTHGVAPGVAALSSMAHGALGAGAKAAGKGVVAGAGAAGGALGRAGAAGMRSIIPTGRAP